jgi:hypothetical protein
MLRSLAEAAAAVLETAAAAATKADKADSSANEGGKEFAESKAVSHHEVHKHLEMLLDHEAVGIGPFRM